MDQGGKGWVEWWIAILNALKVGYSLHPQLDQYTQLLMMLEPPVWGSFGAIFAALVYQILENEADISLHPTLITTRWPDSPGAPWNR